MSQSLSSRAMSFDCDGTDTSYEVHGSQSLSSRAMSFDRISWFIYWWWYNVSIPFEQGNVFRLHLLSKKQMRFCLNPFRAGQCLSTTNTISSLFSTVVSIPFEQGNVFRLTEQAYAYMRKASQSLSSRAMSFDNSLSLLLKQAYQSQSLSSRAMSFDEEIKRTWCIWLYVSIPFEQGNVFRPPHLFKALSIRPCLNPFRAGQCLSTD